MPISIPRNVAIAWLGESWPVLAGLCALYVPTYLRLFTEVWQVSATFHGAVFFALTLWMVWRNRVVLFISARKTKPLAGAIFLFFGLGLFIIGRSQNVLLVETASQIPLLIGVLLIVKGTPALRALWFPIVFLVFVVPLPGSLLDELLLPLKQFVSAVVDQGLFTLGYPIARNGVVLMIGGYQLLIADACAGLNSIIALSGIGLAFIYLANYTNRLHIALLVASILPIALLANIIRVTCLTLITYHLGDDMGQRFHDVAGVVEVFFALGMFFVLDSLLTLNRRVPSNTNVNTSTYAAVKCEPLFSSAIENKRMLLNCGLGVAMFMAIGIPIVFMPQARDLYTSEVNLEQALPQQFGNWKAVPSAFSLADLTLGQNDLTAQFYDQSVMRAYRGPGGVEVMLAVAWGRRQHQEVKVHRPELCYTAQGFQILDKKKVDVRIDGLNIPVTQLVARNSQRLEPVSYWIRLGDSFSSGPVETRLTLLKQGLLGNVPDGILVRASTVSRGDRELQSEFETHQAFLTDLLTHMDGVGRQLMVGNPPVSQMAVR